jgi:pilus assembly protein FimV
LSDEQEKISAEVDEQLEYLFAESGGGESGAEGEAKADPLRELKAIFLAVDWEINDEIMSAMLRQIDSLKKIFAKDRILMLFLQLLGAVGKYIKVQKANAHPDAVKLLNSIYTSLEIVSMSEGMTETERKRILRTEVKRFQSLKEELARQKEPAQKAPETAAETADEPKAADAEVPPALRYVLEEIRKTIRSEFAALRDELKS